MDIRISFAKIRRILGYQPHLSVAEGICELRDALSAGIIRDPADPRYRNAQFIVQ